MLSPKRRIPKESYSSSQRNFSHLTANNFGIGGKKNKNKKFNSHSLHNTRHVTQLTNVTRPASAQNEPDANNWTATTTTTKNVNKMFVHQQSPAVRCVQLGTPSIRRVPATTATSETWKKKKKSHLMRWVRLLTQTANRMATLSAPLTGT
jgi:hypothetical protein